MLDVHNLVRQLLLAQGSITAVTNKISYPDLPKGIELQVGEKAVTFFDRGGSNNPELAEIAECSFQFKTWALKAPDAMALFGKVYDVLDQAQQIDVAPHGFLISGYAESRPQPMSDPDTGWATVVGFFRLTMRAN